MRAMAGTPPSILPPIRDRRVRALAVTTLERVPEVTSLRERGVGLATWSSVVAPAGKPGPFLDRRYAHCAAVALPPGRQRPLARQAPITLRNTPAEYAARFAAERQRRLRLIAGRGNTVEQRATP